MLPGTETGRWQSNRPNRTNMPQRLGRLFLENLRSLPSPLDDADFMRRVVSTPPAPPLRLPEGADPTLAAYAPADVEVTRRMMERLAAMDRTVDEEEVEFDPEVPVRPINGITPPADGEILYDLEALRRLNRSNWVPQEPDDPSLDIETPGERSEES